MNITKIKKIDEINQKKKRLQLLKCTLNNIKYDNEQALDTYIFKLYKNDTFNYQKLCNITKDIIHVLTQEEIDYLLKWIVFRIKKLLPKYNSFTGEKFNPTFDCLCGDAADLAYKLLESLGYFNYRINIKNILKESHNIHAITILILDDKKYVIDPTFRQFLVKEKCIAPIINEYKYGKTVDGAYPGYFLSLTEDGKKFGEKLLNDGYFELTEDNFKLYCDSFMMWINTTNFTDVDYNIRSGKKYIEMLSKCNKHIYYNAIDDIKLTPEQIYLKNIQKENKILLKKKPINKM